MRPTRVSLGFFAASLDLAGVSDDVLYDLVDYLKKQPVAGVAPQRTLICGTTFSPKPGDAKYTAALNEIIKLTGATALNAEDATAGSFARSLHTRCGP